MLNVGPWGPPFARMRAKKHRNHAVLEMRGFLRAAFLGESRKSHLSKRRRSSKPCHPAARRPPKSPACSKFIAEPSRGSFLRRAQESEAVSNP